MQSTTQLLRIDASANTETSNSRRLGDLFVEELLNNEGPLNAVHRDLNQTPAFIDAEWIGASYTAENERSEQQRELLLESDAYIKELKMADRILLTVPMYNFGVPATLKAWIDQVCRAGVTFEYSEQGPKGLLQGKRVDIIITTGGVPLSSPVDFVSGYLTQVFNFIGISDVNIIAADGMAIDAEASFNKAAAQIKQVEAIAA